MAEPMYRRIAQELRERIESGILNPGEQLPTEVELVETYGASRNTIRDAVKWLATRGLVESRPGQGTFVTQRFEPFVTTLSADETGLGGSEGEGAYREIRERGRTPSWSQPRVEVQNAPRYIAERLRIPQGTPVITRRQERYIDKQPWSLQVTAYPMDLFTQGATDLMMAKDIPDGAVSYLARTLDLEEVGHRDRILVRPPSEEEAWFFRLPDDGRISVVSLVRTGYRDLGSGPEPFRATFTTFPADRNQFVINSGSVPRALAEPAVDQHFDGSQTSSVRETS